MHNAKFYLISIVCVLFMFSCGGRDAEAKASPDVKVAKENVDDSTFSEDLHVERNISEIVEDLRRDIKNLQAEVDYQHESLSKLEVQTQVWANPFAIYNKEIVLKLFLDCKKIFEHFWEPKMAFFFETGLLEVFV